MRPSSPSSCEAWSRVARRPRGLSRSRCTRDRLEIDVGLETLAPQLATDAAGLHAAEGGGRVHAVGLVDSEGARSDTACDRETSGAVGRPDRTREPVVAVIRNADGVGVVAIR